MADMVKLTIDGMEVSARKGDLVIRVAERLGIEIPRFCDHPLLDPAGACRQCLVEVEGQRKPLTACTLTVADGMSIKTQLTSELARDAQRGIMEFLLINHPLDCPVCDKGGECPLQNQALSTGRTDSRFVDRKREFVKPIAISTQVLLDRERCVLCQRCTRFSDLIAGDKFIDLMERSANQQIGVFTGDPDDPSSAEPFNSYFSGNTVQICPVGALTGTQYRFRARPFDLVSTPSVCEHCAAGCAQRSDHRRGRVLRRLAGDDPAVNEEWNCDKGRWAFQYTMASDRITEPMIRGGDGELRVVSWPEAVAAAARGLSAARDAGVGVLTGGRLTLEDAYAYATFARVVLGTNDIDFRSRPLSSEETVFLGSCVAGAPGHAADRPAAVSYADIERAPSVVLVGIEPEDECPILFLRLRKAYRRGTSRVLAISPLATRGLEKLGARVLLTAPGHETEVLESSQTVRDALGEPGAVLVVGERLATVPGGLSTAAALATQTGARLAWVPRRAGDRGAVEAGCLPNLLPGGRQVSDASARAELAMAWGLEAGVLPSAPGRHADAILESAAAGKLGALLVGGVDPGDFADPRLARAALEKTDIVISLEIRHSAVTRHADVVIPVAAVTEKAGTYLNWEGRVRSFDPVLPAVGTPSDARVLSALADAMGKSIDCFDVQRVRERLAELTGLPLPGATGAAIRPASELATPPEGRREATTDPRAVVRTPGPATGRPDRERGVRLATWPQLLDLGALQSDEPFLAGTARAPVARISKRTAGELGVVDGDPVSVSTERGVVTLPVAVTDMVDDAVWLPRNSPGSTVAGTLGVTAGAVVEIRSGGGVQ